MGVLEWIRGEALASYEEWRNVLLPRRCPIPWRPNALAPVFYGWRDHGPPDGAPCAVRVVFPTLDGSPQYARILQPCGRYPLVLFAHGECDDDPDQYARWLDPPRHLARAGYVVAVPQLWHTLPAEDEAGLDVLRDLVHWMRSGWRHRSLLAPPPATGVMGHSYGALLSGRLAAEGGVRAFASLSGPWTDWTGAGPGPTLAAIDVPKLFTVGSDPQRDVPPLPANLWSTLSTPRHRVVVDDLHHWDYLPVGVSSCEDGRGPCAPARNVVLDLVTAFFGKYLPPPAAAELPDRIPSSLIPPPLELTPEQAFYASNYLEGFAKLEEAGARCRVSISWETGAATGTLTR